MQMQEERLAGPKVTLGPNPGLSASTVRAQADPVKVWESGQNRREGREMKWATRTGLPEVGGPHLVLWR